MRHEQDWPYGSPKKRASNVLRFSIDKFNCCEPITPAMVATLTASEILDAINAGPTTLTEIRRWLATHGLDLTDDGEAERKAKERENRERALLAKLKAKYE